MVVRLAGHVGHGEVDRRAVGDGHCNRRRDGLALALRSYRCMRFLRGWSVRRRRRRLWSEVHRARSKGKSCFLSNTVASPWLSETSKQMRFSFEDDTKVKREGHVHMRRGAGKSPRVRRPFQDSAVRGEEMKAAAAACGGGHLVGRLQQHEESLSIRTPLPPHQDPSASTSAAVLRRGRGLPQPRPL